MKKNTRSFLTLPFVFLSLFGVLVFNANSASAANCAPSDVFNSVTGQLCGNAPAVVGCYTGYIFSPITGERCGTISSSIMILSPNGGETFTARGNDFITVRWRTVNVPLNTKLDVIRLRNYNTGIEYPLAYSVTNDGSETVYIPSSVPADPYTLEIKSYLGNVLLMDQSDSYFKIANPNTTYLPGCTSNSGYSFTTGAYCGVVSVSKLPVTNVVYTSATQSLPSIGNISPGQLVNFNFVARDNNNNDLSWAINWGDGTSSNLNPGCPLLINNVFSTVHTWNFYGNYNVNVLTSDCQGGTALQSFTVSVR